MRAFALRCTLRAPTPTARLSSTWQPRAAACRCSNGRAEIAAMRSGPGGLPAETGCGHAMVAAQVVNSFQCAASLRTPNSRGRTPLALAAAAGHLPMVRHLVITAGRSAFEVTETHVLASLLQARHLHLIVMSTPTFRTVPVVRSSGEYRVRIVSTRRRLSSNGWTVRPRLAPSSAPHPNLVGRSAHISRIRGDRPRLWCRHHLASRPRRHV